MPDEQPAGTGARKAEGSVPGRTPIVFISDASAETERVTDGLRAAGYLVADVPLSMLSARAAAQRPNVVLLDVDSDGVLEELAKLRRLPGSGSIDFVYLGNGDGAVKDADDALANDGCAFFLRPVDVGGLMRKLEALTGGPVGRLEARPSTPPPSLPPNRAAGERPIRDLPPSSDRPASPSLPAPGVRTPGPPLPMSTTSLADLIDAPRSFASFGTVSNELQQLLADAELRAEIASGPELAMPTPEEEIEAVLPADVLASLDEPIDGDEDEEPGAPEGVVRAGSGTAGHAHHDREGTGVPAKGTTSGGSQKPTTGGGGRVGGTAAQTNERRGVATDAPPRTTGSGAASAASAGGTASGTASGGRTGSATGGGISTTPAAMRRARTSEAAPAFDTRSGSVPQDMQPRGEREAPRGEREAPRDQTRADAPRRDEAPLRSAAPRRGDDAHLRSDAPARAHSPSAAPGLGARRPSSWHPPPSLAPAPVPVFAERGASVLPSAEAPPAAVVLGPADARRFFAEAIARRATGALCFESDGAVRRVVMRDGDLVAAASGAEQESLVHFLASRGELPRDEAPRLAAKIPPYGRHAGAALVAHGWLRQDQLWVVLRMHAEWIATTILGLARGSAQLEPDPPGRLRGEPSVFGAATGAEIFVELVRRAVTPEEALERLGGDASRITDGPNQALLVECNLPPQDLEMIHRARGGTLAGLLARASDGEISSVVHALALLGVLEVVPSPDFGRRDARARSTALQDPEVAALDEDAIRARVRARLELVEEGDYFSVLGVTRDATGYEVRRAFLELRRTFEPARLLTPRLLDLADDVRKIVIVLEEAYEILRDGARRERYRRAIDARPE